MSYKKTLTSNQKQNEKVSQFLEKSVYVREDDQDWGSSGMNDIKDSE